MAGRMRGEVKQPEGLRYVPVFLSDDEETSLLGHLRGLDYDEVRMRGQVARRVVRHYGLSYAFDTAALSAGEPVPDWLSGVRERCAELVSRDPEVLAEVLVTRYPPGATIGWHRDAPAFGDVVGVSLASSCLMRFQRGKPVVSSPTDETCGTRGVRATAAHLRLFVGQLGWARLRHFVFRTARAP